MENDTLKLVLCIVTFIVVGTVGVTVGILWEARKTEKIERELGLAIREKIRLRKVLKDREGIVSHEENPI